MKVALKNGAEEAEFLVCAVIVSLQDLMRENPIVFYELVRLCNDHNYKLFGNTGEVLGKLNLIRDGVVHGSLRNIVLSAIECDELDIRLTSPVTA